MEGVNGLEFLTEVKRSLRDEMKDGGESSKLRAEAEKVVEMLDSWEDAVAGSDPRA